MSAKRPTKPQARHSRESGNPATLDQGGSSAEVALSDRAAFQTFNGLWKGKKEPITRAIVIRNTNFTADGVLDLANVAELDVEAKQLASRTLQRGDIIVERSGGGPKQAVGRVCYFDAVGEHPYSFSNFTSVIRVVDQQRLLPRYVHYFLLHLYKDGYTEGLQHATTGIRNLDFSSYLEAKVPEKPIAEQQKIAAVLWKMQRAIATQDRLIAATRDLKQSAMQHLFTHGLRGEPLKDTEIGLMPSSWEPVSVANCVRPYRFNRACQLPASAYKKQGKWPVVDQGQDEIAGYTDEENKVQRPDSPLIIFGDHSRTLKYVNYPFVFGADGTKPLIVKSGIDPAFLFQALQHLNIPSKGYSRHYKYLAESVLALPGENTEQRDIAAALATIDRKLAHHQQKRATLNDLFQTTLHQLMTAQIRVADLDIDISEVSDHFPDVGKMVARDEQDHVADASNMVDRRRKRAPPDHFVDADEMIVSKSRRPRR
jgi:type I restriction enzyme S subunit